MSNDLPDLLDPWRAVAHAQHYAGEISQHALSRLSSLLAEPGGVVAYRLTFGRDESGRARVQLGITALLRLHCQRCLEVMDWPIDEQVDLALVQGLDEAAALSDTYDPLLLDGSMLRPALLIEDEVLLAIPAIPRHSQCDSLKTAPLRGALAGMHQVGPDSGANEARNGVGGGHQADDLTAHGGLSVRDDQSQDDWPKNGLPENGPVGDEKHQSAGRKDSPFAILADWKSTHR